MKKGFLYGVGIVLLLVGLFSYSLALGLIVTVFAAMGLAKMPVDENIDADLKATTKEIVEAVDPVPETDKLPFVEEDEVPLGEPRMPVVQVCPIPLDKITDQPNQPRH